ncbi:DUF2637 domain-containing protein [Streptomyces mobaraensis]|uniref:DUF2637 domain-containing protein n=1 Tax=Streptomyces mobaraensis TaxID=35621 RepID=UPI003D9E6DA9
MTHPSTPLPVAPVGPWDRLAIVALGSAGCALSYDALQQMAVAIHVRGFLTYLFPLVIDGFIAYGVRALILTRTAPLHARAYVWTLFGTATAASIWANALHAVRLNQQSEHEGLRLGDTVVAILSTLAPLALAGAVHLYILITRHHPRPAPAAEAAAGRNGDGDRPVPVPDQTVDEDCETRRLHVVPDLPRGPLTDQSTAGDRPAGEHAGPRSGTAVPTATGDRDRPAIPDIHGDGTTARHHPADGDGTAARHHPANGDRGPRGVPTPESGGDATAVPDADKDPSSSESLGLELEPTGDRAESVPGTGSPGPRPVPGVVDREGTVPVPETERTGDGPRPNPGSKGEDYVDAIPSDTAGTKESGDRPGKGTRDRSETGGGDRSAKGTGDRSRSSAGRRSRSLTEDEIVQRLRPHVPAVLKRDGNGEVTRVQLRQIMRAQNIAIRNDRLTPVLQRLRSETGNNTTTRSSAR